jgi:predicted nucleic acid-binding protein
VVDSRSGQTIGEASVAGAVVSTESSADRISRALRHAVAEAHLRNAGLAIVGPDEGGAFPGSETRPWGLVGAEVPRVVADANELRGEVIRTCRHGRTVLVTAANTGALRLYLASHVVGEMAEHGERWALEADIDPKDFKECWQSDYLPLARVISDEGLSPDLLDDVERIRVEALTAADSDDVPSAILALCLGAFFLSHDRAPLEAVYGEEVDLQAHRAWLGVLRSSGEAAELGKLVWLSAITPTALFTVASEGARWLARRVSPWVLAAALLGGVWFVNGRMSWRSWRRLRDGAGAGLLAFSELYLHCLQAQQTFARASAPRPTWTDLSDCVPTQSLITRLCMRTVAGSLPGSRSGPELAEALRSRSGIDVVPEMLERNLTAAGCFRQLYNGNWQLGHPAPARRVGVEEPPALDA